MEQGLKNKVEELLAALHDQDLKTVLEVNRMVQKGLSPLANASIFRNKKKRNLASGEVLYREGSTSPVSCDEQQVFIITGGSMVGETTVSEAGHKRAFYGPGDMVGEELTMVRLAHQEKDLKVKYEETIFAGENGAVVVALNVEECCNFFRTNVPQLLKLMNKWMKRGLQAEDMLLKVVNLVRSAEIDSMDYETFKDKVNGMIEIGETELLTATILTLKRIVEDYKRNLEGANASFLEIEEKARAHKQSFESLAELYRAQCKVLMGDSSNDITPEEIRKINAEIGNFDPDEIDTALEVDKT